LCGIAKLSGDLAAQIAIRERVRRNVTAACRCTPTPAN
jgi:hypothetical protein